MSDIPTPPIARAIEARIFGALLGMLASTVFVRLILIVADLPVAVLSGCTLAGALGGIFFMHYADRKAETILGTFDAWNSWLRRISLRAMLWLLAVAAAIGVVTVLTANYETLGTDWRHGDDYRLGRWDCCGACQHWQIAVSRTQPGCSGCSRQ